MNEEIEKYTVVTESSNMKNVSLRCSKKESVRKNTGNHKKWYPTQRNKKMNHVENVIPYKIINATLKLWLPYDW